MKLVERNYEEFKQMENGKIGCKKKGLKLYLDEFLESGFKCAEIIGFECNYQDIVYAQSSICSNIRYHKIHNVKVTIKQHRLFLIRTDLLEAGTTE